MILNLFFEVSKIVYDINYIIILLSKFFIFLSTFLSKSYFHMKNNFLTRVSLFDSNSFLFIDVISTLVVQWN